MAKTVITLLHCISWYSMIEMPGSESVFAPVHFKAIWPTLYAIYFANKYFRDFGLSGEICESLIS